MRAMPSPSCRTVPTSDKSVCTSYCSIRALRICVISSGRSCTFLLLAGRGELSAKSFEAAADARVDAHRAGLENDAADQIRVDGARRVDGAPGRALDLLHDLPRLVVRQLVGRRELDREPAFELGDEPPRARDRLRRSTRGYAPAARRALPAPCRTQSV